MKISDALKFGKKILQESGNINYSLEAEQILESITGFTPIELIKNADQNITDEQVDKYNKNILKRNRGVPLAYVNGFAYFFKNKFLVNESVLIPRPETEIIVERALLISSESPTNILDMGAGSGCIGISIALENKNSRIVMVERSADACKVIKKNCTELNVLDRVDIVNQAVDEYQKNNSRKFKIVTANPPYISESDLEISNEVKMYEPHEALFAGDDGFSSIKEWSVIAFDLLEEGGYFLMECGWKQAQESKKIFEYIGFSFVEILKDLQDIERIVIGRRL